MPRLSNTRIPLDYEKFSKLSEVTGKTWADLSREVGHSPYFLTGIKNRMLEQPVEKFGCNSKNSLPKLEYLFLLNKYGYEFKKEVVEKPKEDPNKRLRKDVPAEQTDTYIAVYFGVMDAMKDYYKWVKEQLDEGEDPMPKMVAPEEPADEVKIKKQKPVIAKG